MTRRSDLLGPSETTTAIRKKPWARLQKAKEHLPQLPFPNHLTDQTISLVRENFPGWDIYALKAQYDCWITEKADRAPTDYNKAFFGFVRSYNTTNR